MAVTAETRSTSAVQLCGKFSSWTMKHIFTWTRGLCSFIVKSDMIMMMMRREYLMQRKGHISRRCHELQSAMQRKSLLQIYNFKCLLNACYLLANCLLSATQQLPKSYPTATQQVPKSYPLPNCCLTLSNSYLTAS